MAIQSINPHNNTENASFEAWSDTVIKQKIDLAHTTYLEWSKTSFEHRADLFHALADIIESDIDELAELQTREMGMLLSASKAGLKSTVHLIRWFADNAGTILQDNEFERDGEK